VRALGGGRTSRLSQALIYKNSVAQSARCSRFAEAHQHYYLHRHRKPGVKLEDLEATVWSELAKLQAEGHQLKSTLEGRTLTRAITGLQGLAGSAAWQIRSTCTTSTPAIPATDQRYRRKQAVTSAPRKPPPPSTSQELRGRRLLHSRQEDPRGRAAQSGRHDANVKIVNP